MTDPSDMDATRVFAKTPLGAAEIQHRSLGLGLLQRRVLLLVDGRRSVADLQKLAGNADVPRLLTELLAQDCVEPQAPPAGAQAEGSGPSVGSPLAAGAAPGLAALPPAQSRSAEQADMARHFMINTINRLLEQNSRLSLVGKIFNSADAAELRTHYPAWEEAVTSSWMGRKRIDELRAKLFAVL